jgi:cyclase
MTSYHTFCQALITILLTGLVAGVVNAQEQPTFKITKLSDHIYKLAADGGGYTIKVIASIGKDGTLLVDTGQRRTATSLRAALESIGGANPRFIINTHAHEEHTGGNVIFGSGPVFIGHASLRSRLTSGSYVFDEFPDEALPSVSFTDSLSLFFNGEEIKLMAFPGAHDDGDIVIWFTGSKIVCVGALSNSPHFPSVDERGGNAIKYPETVERLIAILPEDVTVIPGHGDDHSMSDFRAFHRMLVDTREAVRAGLAEGKDLAKLQAEDVLKPWASFEGSYVDRNQWIEYLVEGFQPPVRKPTIFAMIHTALKEKGLDAAVELYYDLKRNHAEEYSLEETDVVYVGYKLSQHDRTAEATRFFEVCASEFPTGKYAYYCHHRIGDAYKAQGRKDLALEHYRKAVELNPEDTEAATMVKELEAGE